VAEGDEDLQHKKSAGSEGGIKQGKDNIPNKKRWRTREKKKREREKVFKDELG
jgi:hypothetical protein